MMHDRRRWMVGSVASPEELAEMLTQRTWTLCSGFVVVGHEEYLFLNDATCEDGAGEFGVIKGRVDAPAHEQIESITFSWCTREEGLGFIRQALAGEYDVSTFVKPVDLRGKLDAPEKHGNCRLCA